MKTEQLKDIAKKTLDFHSKEDEVLVTTDGHSFLKKNESFANNHAMRNGTQVVTYTREEIMGTDKVTAKTEESTTIPEGDPTEDWPDDHIKKWMIEMEIAFTDEDSKEVLLKSIDEA